MSTSTSPPSAHPTSAIRYCDEDARTTCGATGSTETVEPELVEFIIDRACRAPSVDNTQPWRWHVRPNGFNLMLADGASSASEVATMAPSLATSSATSVASQRDLTVSCGAALHHARVASAALGWHAKVRHAPDREFPELLARVALSPSRVRPEALTDLVTMQSRRTDRRRFTTWPVPPRLQAELAAVATWWGTQARPIIQIGDKMHLARLVGTSALPTTLRSDLPAAHPTAHTPSFTSAAATAVPTPDGTSLQPSDGMIVLAGRADDACSWLAAGEGLSALWLAAHQRGISVVPLVAPLTNPEATNFLRYQILDGLEPHLLIRLGWLPIGISELSPSPRRPLAEVMATTGGSRRQPAPPPAEPQPRAPLS